MTRKSLRRSSRCFVGAALVLVAINCAGPAADTPEEGTEGTHQPTAETILGPHAEVTILTTNAADFFG